MDSFNISKDGKPPKKPGEEKLAPADRAKKGLFVKKKRPGKPAPAVPEAQAGTQTRPAKPPLKPGLARKQPKQKMAASAGAKPASSNTSKVILFIILGVVVVGAGGFFIFNNFINKPVEMPVGNVSINGHVLKKHVPHPGMPGEVNPAGQPVGETAKQPGRPGAAVPKSSELPQLPEKGRPAQPAKQAASAPQAQVPPVVNKKAAPVHKQPPAPAAVKPVAEAKQAQPQKAPAMNINTNTNIAGAVAALVPARKAAKPVVKAVAPAAARHAAVSKPKPKQTAYARRQSEHRPAAAPRRRAAAAAVSYRRVSPVTTVQISSLPPGLDQTSQQGMLKTEDEFYSWPGGKSAGHNKDIFDSQPSLLKQEHEKTMDQFSSSKKLYMVLVKEADNSEELKTFGKSLPNITPPPEIKETESHGKQVFWLTVGHYTTADKAYNKAQELKSFGVETTVVSEKIYY